MERLALPWIVGVDFLPIYAAVLLGAVLVALVVRWRLRQPGPTADDRLLDVYEVAYLRGGPRRVAAAAVGALLERGVLALDGLTENPGLNRGDAILPANAPPIERAVAG